MATILIDKIHTPKCNNHMAINQNDGTKRVSKEIWRYTSWMISFISNRYMKIEFQNKVLV